MTCDQCLELLSVQLDGVLTEAGERELEAHMKSCPACRAAGAQLAALQSAFDDLGDVSVPEGFAQGVMERIREPEAEKNVLPLFRRPWFKALAGLAACAALAAGVYGAAHPQAKRADAENWDLMARSFNQDAVIEGADGSAYEGLQTDADVSMAAVYSDTEIPVETENDTGREMQKVFQEGVVNYAAPMVDAAVLTVERMPEGGWELIPPETPVSPEGLYVSEELLEQVEQLAQEQGITASITSGTEEAEEFIIVVLEEIK